MTQITTRSSLIGHLVFVSLVYYYNSVILFLQRMVYDRKYFEKFLVE